MEVELQARVGETEAELEKRYGKRVSKGDYEQIERGFDARQEAELAQMSADEKTTNLKEQKRAFPERFHSDGSEIDYSGQDWIALADRLLMFFDPDIVRWEVLESSVVGRIASDADSQPLRQLTANARKHLSQRFYILNDIAISVVLLGGRSVSESYRQKGAFFSVETMDTLIKNSFPEARLAEEELGADLRVRLVKLLSTSNNELLGCATLIDHEIKVTAYPYFGFLKAMEVGLRNNEVQKQRNKLEGF